MSSFDGALARTLDFGDVEEASAPGAAGAPAVGAAAPAIGPARSHVRSWAVRRRGPMHDAQVGVLADRQDKYVVLEARRRRAQITARHLLDLLEDRPSD